MTNKNALDNSCYQRELLKIPKVFYLIEHNSGWFFRFFNRWGISCDMNKKHINHELSFNLRFSERYGYSGFIITKNHIFRFLK